MTKAELELEVERLNAENAENDEQGTTPRGRVR